MLKIISKSQNYEQIFEIILHFFVLYYFFEVYIKVNCYCVIHWSFWTKYFWTIFTDKINTILTKNSCSLITTIFYSQDIYIIFLFVSFKSNIFKFKFNKFQKICIFGLLFWPEITTISIKLQHLLSSRRKWTLCI
jgi:hypothetical protein